jgi:hypothetical protein
MNVRSIQRLLVTAAALALVAQTGAAQTATANLKLDPQRSLVWWQIDPHFGHLWASSCPKDPSWQPGEGHSAGYYVNYAARPKISTTKQNEVRIPLFPRRTVRPNCRNAVSGTFSADTNNWGAVKGSIAVIADSIETGANHRDAFATKYVYSSANYPTINFTVDSLTSIAVTGDTVTAVAVGTFRLRGVDKASRVQVKGVKEASGMRVRGMFAMPASELRDRFGVSQFAMGAGVGLKLWDTLFMGFDLILIPSEGSSGAGSGASPDGR